RRAVNNTIKYIPHHYYKNHLSDLQEILKNPNLRSVWVATNSENNDAAFWSKVSQLGLIHFFSLLSESSREYEIFKKAFSGLSIQRIRQIRKTDSSAVTNPDLILDNFMKFAELVKKLVYSEDLNYITGSTLPHDETTISSIDDIHPKINYILQNDAVATQVRAIALKVPIGKIPPMIVAMLPTKDGAKSEFNAQLIIMNEASGFLEYKDAFYNINFKAPIYEDKQDDNAALRTFHSNNLMQIPVNGNLTEESIGLFVYLFVLGELCDAYLNRTIDHKTRIEMVLPGIIDTSRDCNSAAGYVFDIDGTSLPHETIEILRTWPTTDDIKESTVIAFNEAMSLANYLHIKHNEYTIPPIITSTENMNNAFSEDNGDQYCEINDSSNELNLESISLTGNAALEVACLLSNFPDIQYIQNSQVVPVAFQPFQLFIANNVLDITAILEIRKSHDAFSHNLQSNFTNSQQIINTNNSATNGNTFNRIITEIAANNVNEVQRRQ
ncbi:6279_t:CDS:10, partial [Entrophospora sp. SA101]